MGSYEERRARAFDQRARESALQQELMRRRPSPKHMRNSENVKVFDEVSQLCAKLVDIHDSLN